MVYPEAHVRVRLCNGMVAWIHASRHGRYFSAALMGHLALTQRELEQILTTCRARGRRLGEYLVGEGLCSFQQMRAVMVAHFRAHFSASRGAGPPSAATFEPMSERYETRLSFRLEELVSTVGLPPGGGPVGFAHGIVNGCRPAANLRSLRVVDGARRCLAARVGSATEPTEGVPTVLRTVALPGEPDLWLEIGTAGSCDPPVVAFRTRGLMVYLGQE